jgi:hypothetical protein
MANGKWLKATPKFRSKPEDITLKLFSSSKIQLATSASAGQSWRYFMNEPRAVRFKVHSG